VWATLDGPTGKRMAPFMPQVVQAMERHGELRMDPEVRAKLLRVSATTIDRLLAPDRRGLQMKGAPAPSRDRSSSARSPSGPSPIGTMTVPVL
jgi:hypothetical protein